MFSFTKVDTFFYPLNMKSLNVTVKAFLIYLCSQMIFILDDNREDLEIIGWHLEKSGIVGFRLFDDYDSFLRELDRNVVIVIIDHTLQAQGKTGLDIMKEVLYKVPICYPIIVSGNESKDVILSYMNNDGFRYVLKNNPNYLDDLVRYIRQADNKINTIIKYVAKHG